MRTQWSSAEILDAFRALGGTAENIRLDVDEGKLFAHDPERPVLLRVPENLLFSAKAFEFVEGVLRLKDPDEASPGARDFLVGYENAMGRAVFERAAAAIDALDSLPATVKELLSRDFGMRQLFEGERAVRIENRIISRRAIRKGDGLVIAPVLELAEPDARGLAIEFGNGIRIGGIAQGGVRVLCPFLDALAIFQQSGFAAAQPAAFSLPMTIMSGETEISIGRELHLGERRGEVTVPQLNVVANNRLALSHLMLGHSSFPRLARGIFCSRMGDANVSESDAQFDRIVQENSARLLRLLGALDRTEGATAAALRHMARHQLQAMSWSIGTRKI